MKNSKNIVKIISITSIVTIIGGVLVGCSVDWSFPDWIYVSGSSTIQPLIKEISKIYSKAEIIAEAGGSSTGISNVANFSKDVGAASRQPKISEAGLPAISSEYAQEGIFSKQWSSLAMKTITIGYDGIGIIYKCKQLNDNYNLTIGDNNILNLYDIFTGNEVKKMNFLDASLPPISIKAFVRSGGANTSGTAEAFLEDSSLKLPSSDNDQKWNNIKKILSSGNYGPYVTQTAESNLITWNNIKNNSSNNNFAYITYLSTGFIKNNYQTIINEGFKIALYQPTGTTEKIPLLNENNELNVPEKYKWYRPLNLIVRLHDDKNTGSFQTIKEFIMWLKNESSNKDSGLVKIYNEIGYILLPPEKWNTMCKENKFTENNFWISDYDLYKLQYDERKKNKKYYGAI